MKLGDRLKLARTKRGLSTASLSQLAGLKSKDTVRLIEIGETSNPGIETLRKFAEVLMVSFSWLTEGSGEMETVPNNQKPGWAGAESEVNSKGLAPDSIVWHVGQRSAVAYPSVVTAEFIVSLVKDELGRLSQDELRAIQNRFHAYQAEQLRLRHASGAASSPPPSPKPQESSGHRSGSHAVEEANQIDPAASRRK